MNLLIDLIAGKGDNHRALFLRNELKALFGKKSKNLKTLFYFSLLAFFAITFAQSGLVYLGYRMDNPYINWLTFPVSADIDNRYGLILSSLEDYKDKGVYSLDNVNGFHRYSLIFRNLEGKELDRVKGRTMAFPQDSLLFQKVLSKENLISSKISSYDQSTWDDRYLKYGVILTEELYDEIGCADDGSVYAEVRDYCLDLEVIAIVRSLPDRALFMTSYELYWGLQKSTEAGQSVFRYPNAKSMGVLVNSGGDPGGLQTELKQLMKRLSAESGVELESITMQAYENSCVFDQELTLVMTREPTEDKYNSLFEGVYSELGYYKPFVLEKYDMFRIGELSSQQESKYRSGSKNNTYSSVTLHFAEIDSIRQFRKLMLNEQEVDISLEQIEARENFNLVSILTNILALALMLFTLVSITIFISNVLRSHLERIKMNLGTFMAFGLSKDFLISGYTRLIIGMLIAVSLMVLVILLIIDYLNLPYLVLDLLGMNLKADFTEAFSVWNPWLFFLISLILFFTWRRCRSLVSSFIRHYPSDLIYNRT
jgi:hypothetical protein